MNLAARQPELMDAMDEHDIGIGGVIGDEARLPLVSRCSMMWTRPFRLMTRWPQPVMARAALRRHYEWTGQHALAPA
ncbi:MAG: hypothetical protein ACRELT_00425, partial [Longimicrobiales bacterium]